MSPAKPGTIRHSADLEPTPRPTPCDVRAELARKSLRHPELRQAAPYSNRQAQHDWLEREPGPLVLGPAPRSRSPGLWSVLEMPNRGDASRRLRCSWQRRAGPRYEPRWRPWCRSFKVRYARRRRLVRCSEVILVRAVAVSEYGASPALVDVPDPHPGPRQVLIKVHAAGMNPMDVSIANGAWASRFAATFPLILGVDVAGTIEAVGENAARFVVGDEVSPERKWPRCQPAREALLATSDTLAVSRWARSPQPRVGRYQRMRLIEQRAGEGRSVQRVALHDLAQIPAGDGICIGQAAAVERGPSSHRAVTPRDGHRLGVYAIEAGR